MTEHLIIPECLCISKMAWDRLDDKSGAAELHSPTQMPMNSTFAFAMAVSAVVTFL